MNRLLVINLSAVRIDCSFKRDVLVTLGTPATQVGPDWFLSNCQRWRKVRLKCLFFFFWRTVFCTVFSFYKSVRVQRICVFWGYWNIHHTKSCFFFFFLNSFPPTTFVITQFSAKFYLNRPKTGDQVPISGMDQSLLRQNKRWLLVNCAMIGYRYVIR